jgi:hypothetical protein
MSVHLELTTGEAHHNRPVTELLSDLKSARCCWLIEGSEIAKTQSVLANICIGRAIWWSASS